MDLEFRKFLTSYGITYEEYMDMEDEKKKELIDEFNKEQRTVGLQKLGEGMQGCGCSLMLLPVVIFLLFFIYLIITS